MKTSFIKEAIMMLLLVGSFPTCTKRGESSGDVSYKPCQCEEGESIQPMQRGDPLVNWVLQEEAYLFKDFLSEQLPDMYDDYDHFTLKYCIIYNSKTKAVCIYEWGNMYADMGRICNLPDIVSEWKIPENGCKVYFEGTKYHACEHTSRDCCSDNDNFGFDFILTHFKRL